MIQSLNTLEDLEAMCRSANPFLTADDLHYGLQSGGNDEVLVVGDQMLAFPACVGADNRIACIATLVFNDYIERSGPNVSPDGVLPYVRRRRRLGAVGQQSR